MATCQLSNAVSHIDHVETKLYGQPLNGRGDTEGDAPAANDQYRPRLHLFKAQMHLLNKNVKGCKKELKSYTTAAGNVRQTAGLQSYHYTLIDHVVHITECLYSIP